MRSTLYDALGGHDALMRLAHAWHERVLVDPVVGHAFEHGYHPDHTARLAAYWAEAFGGPAAYTSSVASHADVVRMHSGNGEHPEMDRRAIACFAEAVDAADLPDDPALRSTLIAYFTELTARMTDYHASAHDVPAEIDLPHWGVDGPTG